jgi:cytochrome c
MGRWHGRRRTDGPQVVFLHTKLRGCFGVMWHAAALLCAVAGAACSQPVPGNAETARGRELLARHHCGSCHTIPGVKAAQGHVAVTLESFGRRSYIAGRLPNTDENLARWLVDPAALVPGTLMPAMGVSAADARDMATYLRSLR